MDEFDDQRSVAFMPREQLIAYLEKIGDIDALAEAKAAKPTGQGSFGRLVGRAWANPEHAIGFIPETDPSVQFRDIMPVLMVEGDKALIDQRIKLNLDAFYVQDYPGYGTHTVAIEFSGQDQTESEARALKYVTALDVVDKSSANISGIPIFSGLKVPQDGVAFKFRTILIESSADEAIINVLKGSLFKTGLTMLGQVQPVLPQLVSLAAGVTQSLFDHGNEQVQAYELGLDFSSTGSTARLRCGSYVLAQVKDKSQWTWDDWTFSADTMSVVRKDDHKSRAPVNTVIFSVSKSAATEAKSIKPPEKKAKKPA